MLELRTGCRCQLGGLAQVAQPPLTGDPATSLSELLSWSHRQLSPPAAAMFVLLGVHCGPDITVPAAASLAGVPAADARRALAELAGASLAAEHRPGRYVLHDLVRGYAGGHARQAVGATGTQEAVGRSLDHYLHTMLVSTDLPVSSMPVSHAPGVVPERLADAQLQDWANAEQQVLLQATAQAAAEGLITRAWQIFACQGLLLSGHGYWADFRAAGQAVLAAAEAAGHHTGLGWAHATIGRNATLTGAPDDGRAHLAQALDHFRQAGDLIGQAWVHLYAAHPDARNAAWAAAATQCEQAVALFRQAGDQGGERWALVGLGGCHARLGNYELARGCAGQALALGLDAGDSVYRARAWSLLGLVHSRLGEHRQAISCYEQAVALAREWTAPLLRRLLAGLLASFGDACQAAGDLPAAAGAWQQALQVLHDLGLPDTRRIGAKLERASPPSPPG